MLWTCARCSYSRVRWRPKTWTEAQVGAVARARCEGKSSSVLKGARGFVFLGDKFAADTPIRCPSCCQKFYPGDSLERRVPAPDAPHAAPQRPALAG